MNPESFDERSPYRTAVILLGRFSLRNHPFASSILLTCQGIMNNRQIQIHG